MGFADNTKKTQSSRMLSLSNCDHSEGNWGRLLMENGHYDSRVGFPKCKRGRVSAIRDFRPGCGQFAPRISLRPTEEAISNGIVQNSVDQGKSCDAFGDGIWHVSRSPEVLENFDFTVIPRQTIDVESKPEAPVVSSDQVDGLSLLNTTLLKMPCPEAPDTFSNAGDIEPLKSSEHERFNVPKDLHNVDISAPVESMVPRHYPSRRKISAVRDFPPLCGRNAPRLIKESANMLASTENRNFGKQELYVKEEVMKCVDVKQMVEDDNVLNRDAHKHRLERNSSSLREVNSQAESKVPTTIDMKNQDEYGNCCGNKMKVCQEDLLEESINSPVESIQNLSCLKSESVPESGKRRIQGLEDNLGMEFEFKMEKKSSTSKFLAIKI